MDTLHPGVVWHVGKSGRDVQRQHGAGWKRGCPHYRHLYVDESINTLTLVKYDTKRGYSQRWPARPAVEPASGFYDNID